jgi:hypothetical protein
MGFQVFGIIMREGGVRPEVSAVIEQHWMPLNTTDASNERNSAEQNTKQRTTLEFFVLLSHSHHRCSGIQTM